MCLGFPLVGAVEAALSNDAVTWTLILTVGLIRSIIGLNVFTR